MTTRSPLDGARIESALAALGAIGLVLVIVLLVAPDARRGAAAWLTLGPLAGAPPDAAAARVGRIVDGDTIELADGTVVRLLGLDTPETHHPDMDGPQPLGEAASERLAALVGGRLVALEADAAPTDHYGRQLRHVWLGRRLVSEVMLGEGLGHALVIPPNVRHAERLRAAENAARAAGRGVWGLPRPTPLAIFATPAHGGSVP